MYNIRYCI